MSKSQTETQSVSTASTRESGSAFGTFKNANECPDPLTATIAKIENKNDKRDNMCLYLTLQFGDDYTVQKYTDTTKSVLADAFEKLGLKNITVGQKLVWEARREGRSQFDRFFPIKVVSGSKK